MGPTPPPGHLFSGCRLQNRPKSGLERQSIRWARCRTAVAIGVYGYNRWVRPSLIVGEKMRRSSVMFLARAALVALAFVGSACDNGPDSPVVPTPTATTETFTGTITLNGSVTHPFTTAVVGRTTATISAINPA